MSDPEWGLAVELIRGAQRVLICSHRKPDGDAIGSLTGLGWALEAMGKEVTLACADPAPNTLALIPGAGKIVNNASTASQNSRDLLNPAVTIIPLRNLLVLGGLNLRLARAALG